MQSQSDFFSIYRHDFIRAAVCMPAVKVADPAYNAARTIELAQRAADGKAVLALFPELGLSAYSCEDLFHQDALLEAVLTALADVTEASRQLAPVLLVGAPLRFHGRLFNCAVAIHRGRILGIAPKTYLPNYREFYEKRQFTSGRDAISRDVVLLDQTVPFGNDILYEAANLPGLTIHTEICEDLWAPIPPSTHAALAGATVLCNLSASNVTIGKADYRRALCAAHSGKTVAAYLYSAAGFGESTNDVAWDGQALIFENSELLAESERFSLDEQILLADIDLGRLAQDRMRLTSFNDAASEQQQAVRRVRFELDIPLGADTLLRRIERFPFVPSDPATRDARCYEAYNIQVHGLMKRIRATGIERIVIGVSGGLDSTQALIVAAQAMDRLGLPRSNILAYTMPGFATSSRTLENAHALMQALRVSAEEIDIRPSCLQMLQDIGHPYADGKPVYDVTFENVQAGERTSHLFRLANRHHGLVLGTGDLSEGALGWSTYGVGDHMSHYNVNASVPKTLIQYLIRWVIATHQLDDATIAVLQAVVDTEISPELVPGASADEASQSTESQIGPYELQDFNIYYITRYGFRPSKVAFLAHQAWHDKTRGEWPPHIAAAARNEYALADIKTWLKLFIYRFFKISQYKRTAVPNGPKVGSGGSLSPRGDWRAPSDSEIAPWMDELERNVPDV
jgi:NAD+ synthase (glutamine-hydrolysing)